MAVDFARKLLLTAEALGCTSRKVFCARFRAVNVATEVDLDRLNKWMQGRSQPRASSVYADLGKMIGSAKPARWIEDCDLDDFTSELTALTGFVPDGDAPFRSMPARPSVTGLSGLFGGLSGLAGTFVAFSRAWSPHFQGQMIRGTLRLTPDRGRDLNAVYRESLMNRTVEMTGRVLIRGRTMHIPLAEPEGDMPFFMTMLVPGPPASVLCGVISGVAFVAHDPLPSASRILCVRVPDDPALDRSNRYMAPAPGAIAADLQASGLPMTTAGDFDAAVREFLRPAPDQVTSRDHAAFADMLDRANLPLC